MDENGPIAKFEVLLESAGDEPISHQISSSNASHHTFTNIQSGKSGSVRIKAGTNVGMSAASSPIYINKGDYKPPPFVLEKVNRDIMMSWETETTKGIKGYTIYWCERTNGCEKQLQWAHVSVDAKSYTVQKLDFEKIYLFGLSLDSDNKSTGFSWENCYFIRNEIPQRPKSVTVQDRDKQSITIVWARPGPCERSPFVEFYSLYWCQADDKGTECLIGTNSSMRINSSISKVEMQYTIRNLKSETRYVVWLIAVSSAGMQSLEGEKNYNVTTMDSLQSDTGAMNLAAAIGIPIIAVVIVICLLIAEISCHLCRKIKEMSRPYEIEVPSIHIKDTTLRNLDKGGVYKHCTINRGLSGHDNKSLDILNEQTKNPVNAISECVYNEEQKRNSYHILVGDYLAKDSPAVHNMDTSIQHQGSLQSQDDVTPENSSSALISLITVTYPAPLPKEKNETDCLTDEYSEKLDELLENNFNGSSSSVSKDITVESENISSYVSHPISTSVIAMSEDKSKDENTDAAIQKKTPTVIPSNSEYVSMNTICDQNGSSGIGTCSHPFSFNCSADTSLASQATSNTVLAYKHKKPLTLQIYPGSFDLNKSFEGSPESLTSSESISSVEGIDFPDKYIDCNTTLKTSESVDYSLLRNYTVTSPRISPVDTPPVLMNNNLRMRFNGYVFDINNPKQTIQNNFLKKISEGELQNRPQQMTNVMFPVLDNLRSDTEVVPDISYDNNGNDITNCSTNSNNGGYIHHSAIQKGYNNGNNLCVINVQDEKI
ncbi:putative mediator of RNA polymerase II transcription subunit 26 [Mytilus trossulus]|uniref:putative mediator of RNA polymerase II transcription subunit 26 n=1 Tax=Mytilus trossulus TaxID=6551 RepID=UPI003004B6C1